MKTHKAEWARYVAAGILVLSCWIPCVGAVVEPHDKATPPTQGYNCLFMGHSFFAPIAKSFAEHPARCGFPGHKQTIVAHGGTKGAPGALWASKEPDVAQARKMLESGTVDLLGLTCYPGEGSDLSDYRRWIDLALKNNPRTCILIQAPWSKYENRTLAQYDAESEEILKYVHRLIDQLRLVYPRTTFICIPQGRWMVGLWRLYEKRELPEVSVLKSKTATDKEPCLFRDNLGHGGDLPVKMGALLWLAAIYKVDLNTYPWQTHTKFDLKALAQDIVNNDPYCGLRLKPSYRGRSK